MALWGQKEVTARPFLLGDNHFKSEKKRQREKRKEEKRQIVFFDRLEMWDLCRLERSYKRGAIMKLLHDSSLCQLNVLENEF